MISAVGDSGQHFFPRLPMLPQPPRCLPQHKWYPIHMQTWAQTWKITIFSISTAVVFFWQQMKKSTLAIEAGRFGKVRRTRQVSSMIHSARPTVSPVVSIVFASNLFCFARFWKVGTDNMYENNYHYRPWLWVGRVDQYFWKICSIPHSWKRWNKSYIVIAWYGFAAKKLDRQ